MVLLGAHSIYYETRREEERVGDSSKIILPTTKLHAVSFFY